jgi:hypothetical protein
MGVTPTLGRYMNHVLYKPLRSTACVGTMLQHLTKSGRDLCRLKLVETHSDLRRVATKILSIVLLTLTGTTAHAALSVLIVEGLGGEAKYQQQFDKEAKAIQVASAALTSTEHIQLLMGEMATRANITAALKQLATSLTRQDRLIVYLIGHGSHDGYEYKFNIPGADISGTELAKLLGAIKSASQLVIATGSSSGALQEFLKNESRIVVTATRNGNERNATQFGSLFAEALSDVATDTDKNGRITIQEAFDFTVRKVQDYFKEASRLATEHAQLVGVRADVFAIAQLEGVNEPIVTANADLLAEREQLNSQIEELRLRKDSLTEDEYFKQLEAVMLQVAELDARIAAESASPSQAEVAP